ncbi:MAG TPA: type II toxin-antitoxin system prevent-host-death family antitoxin [Mycobacteriales bacterium]|jgi:prevent-host-death family protein
MTFEIPLAHAAIRFGELVDWVRYQHEPVLLTEDGVPVVAIISIPDLEELQRAKDAEDLALCHAISACSDPGISPEKSVAISKTDDALRP